MRQFARWLIVALFAGSLAAFPVRAQEAPKPEKLKEEKKPAAPPEEKISQTRHSARIGGQDLKYTATAGTILLKQEDGTPKASLFFVAYTRDDVSDLTQRPITFSFHGGPGSSSVWLHLGALGPRRVEMGDAGALLPPPYKLVDNEDSILDLADLVFIDPVTTGFSRAVPGEDDKKYHAIEEDIVSVAEFIRLYSTRYKRWASPKFLAGESYGTTRAAGLSGYLQQHDGLYLNGIVLISSVLNFETLEFDRGNDLPYILYVPSYTATAWYHKKLSPDLQSDLHKALEESEAFAMGDYTLALAAGDNLPDARRHEIAQKLARLTGLSPEFVERSNLRLTLGRFTKELLRDQRRTVGRLDSRFIGIDADSAADRPEYDPSYAAIQGPYTALFNNYVRTELNFESDLPYEILTGRVQPWSFQPYENRYVNVAETLRSAMTQNPSLRVFVAKGYYDLATPFFAADYTFDHLGLDPSLRSHLSADYFEAGHMVYVHRPSLEKLKADIAQFIRSALAK